MATFDKEKSKETVRRIKTEIPITYIAEREGFHLIKSGKYYHLKEHDSVILYTDTNSYYRFSDKTGGSNIDFLINLKGMILKDAINSLKSELDKPIKTEPKVKENTEFKLPEKAINNNRLIAYLNKTRKLDMDVINNFIENEKIGKSYIYQDINNNVVFVGCDKDGVEKFATLRTTLSFSSFRHDIKNCDKSTAWSIDNNADTLFVCEAPIDMMSLMNLQKSYGEDVPNASYLAMCGVTNDKSVYKFIDEHSGISKVTLALDDDEPGRASDKKIAKRLLEKYSNIEVSFQKPVFGKDLNDELVHRKEQDKVVFKTAENIIKDEVQRQKSELGMVV